jgi:hypothetical protein
MDGLWDKLPVDIINCILQYDGRISHRNGVYINKIRNPDILYPLLFERMRFQRFRRFLSKVSFVTIVLPTEKHICYWASNQGLQITMFTPLEDDEYSMIEEKLFTNMVK